MLGLGVRPGVQAAVVLDEGIDDDTRLNAERLIEELAKAEVNIAAVVGPTSGVGAKNVKAGPIAAIDGTTRVRGIRVGADAREIACDCVVWCSRPVPDHILARQMGIDTPFAVEIGGFVPRCDAQGQTSRSGVFVAGEVAGINENGAADHGRRVASAVVELLAKQKDSGAAVKLGRGAN
jgi:thioredoxin reductase